MDCYEGSAFTRASYGKGLMDIQMGINVVDAVIKGFFILSVDFRYFGRY